MSPAFIKGIEEHFPSANITFDKFHVMKMVNEAVNDIRKDEQNLTINEQKQFTSIKDLNLKTARAYRLKLAFQEFWNIPAIYADLYFERWYQWSVRSQLKSMADLAKSLKRHEDGILRWFISRMTNGLLEGVNGMIQAAKRKARGYRTVTNLIHMIYATVNKLDVIVKSH
ncbi:transposase [Tepidibacillus marianensis]|uniref:transposase n=1 Tax=Tepidibacillus marianensis TaxID=3131995 RepID=UPI0030D0458C